MARMRAIEAAVLVMRREGVDTAFGVPGAAINPLYAALKKLGGIDHVLARHVEGASHMAEGYTRTNAGNIGVCIGTSGPAGTDMVTGLYSASADSIPILCITGQAPRARLHKEDFQAVDITSIVKPVTKWATTVLEPGQVPYAFQKAFYEMRSGRPGPVLIDLPFDVRAIGYGHRSDEVEQVRAPGSLLREYAAAVHTRCVEWIRTVSETDLDRIVDTRWDPPVTLGVRLVSVADDSAQHIGQAAYVKGLLGHSST